MIWDKLRQLVASLNPQPSTLTLMVAAIAERGCLGLLALAEPGILGLIKVNLQAFEGHAFNDLVPAIAERLFLAEATGAPGVGFFGNNRDANRFGCGYMGFGHFDRLVTHVHTKDWI